MFQYGAARPFRKLFATVLCLNLLVAPLYAAPAKIAMLGDSLTQGYGLPESDGLVPQLQAWLQAHKIDAELLNAGVSGDTTAGGLSRIDWTLTPDIKAVVVELGGNDILRGLSPALSRSNLDAILKKIKARDLPVLLVGVKAPANYGSEYTDAFDSIYPDLARKYDTLLFADYMGPLLQGRSIAEAQQAFMQPDGLHPNKAGVAQIVQKFGPELAKLIAEIK